MKEDDPKRGFNDRRAFLTGVPLAACGGEASENLKSLAVVTSDGVRSFDLPRAFSAGSDESMVADAAHGGALVGTQRINMPLMIGWAAIRRRP